MIPTSSAILTKTGVAVAAKGEQVILTIGNTEIPMHFEHALDLSQWVRKSSAAIKRGLQQPKTIRSVGILHDATASNPKPLPYTEGTAIHVKQPLKVWKPEDVVIEGRLLVIRIGPHTMRLHYRDALKIAQWLRVRAKECQRIAGDTRHWSETGNTEQ